VAFEIERAGRDCNLDSTLPGVGKLEQEFEKFKSMFSDPGLSDNGKTTKGGLR